MEARELRIGSLLKDNLTGEWLRVTDLSENIVAEVINRDKYPLPDGWQMAPIPLTPEILEKAGFIFVHKTNQYGWYLTVENRSLCWCHSDYVSLEFNAGQHDDYSHALFEFPCKHVHQLQNLFYCLTGTELNIALANL